MKLRLNGYTNMRRQLALEYRLYKLEKLFNEDSFDDELDAMSDDIVKNNPNIDIDAELDKKAKDIIDKEPGYFYKNDPFGDHVKTYDTIEDWLDDKTVEIQLNPARPHKGDVVKDLNLAIKQLTHVIDGLNYVRRLKNYIKEISDMNVLKAQQKLVSALRKRIKEVENNKKLDKELKPTNKWGDKFEFNTIEEWADHIIFRTRIDYPDEDVVAAEKRLQEYLDETTLFGSDSIDGGIDITGVLGLRKVLSLKPYIKEINDMSTLKAQQRLASVLRKKIKELKLQN